jgi:hypothetical protein
MGGFSEINPVKPIKVGPLFAHQPALPHFRVCLDKARDKDSCENAGAKLDHITPRERHDAAEQN